MQFPFTLKMKQAQKFPSLMCGSLGSQDVVLSSRTECLMSDAGAGGGSCGFEVYHTIRTFESVLRVECEYHTV